MKPHIFLIISAFVIAPLRAEVFQGSFEWRRTGVIGYSDATFEFDSDTGTGTIVGLNPNQGSYVSYGLWNFTLGVVDRNLFGDRVVINSPHELIDFTSRPITINPSFGSTDPYSVIGELKWMIRLGNANGTITNGYSLTDGAFFNAYYESGDVNNFTLIPEPASYTCITGLLMASLALSKRRKRG